MTGSNQALPGIAVIGCGLWGRNHVRTLATLGALRAVHDADPDAAAAAAASGNVPTRSFDEILGDPAIDGVVIATPDATHAAIAQPALEAGKHVLVEKPMTTSTGDGARLVALASEAGLILMTGHILLYHPGFLRLRDLTRDGMLGSLRHIASKRHHIARGAPRHALWDLGPHDVSMVLELTGRLPSEVSAQAASPLENAPPQQVSLLLTYPDGLSADISLSAIHPVKLHQITVSGTAAFGVFEDSQDWQDKVTVIRPGLEGGGTAAGSPASETVPLEPDEPLRLEIEAFLGAICGGPPPPSNGREALEVVCVLAAAERSLTIGTAVTLDSAAHDNLET
ncbi:MAG: Gfo/Idh/MocA family oxidoreductase [Alphaproteobacteria bacterium]|nr:Gfo/Idh/MocA family oxidoreductase [Alphaproteobacteria bacterium]